jgi:acyl carrier protein
MSPHREQIAAFAKEILVGFLDGFTEDDITEETPIGEGGLAVESIGILEVVVNLEQEYDISIPDEIIERFASSTFGVLVDEIMTLASATVETESGVR